MSRGLLVLRLACGAGLLLGGWLVASGTVNLVRDGGEPWGPVGRVVVGALVLSAAVVTLMVSQRDLPRSQRLDPQTDQPEAAAGAETVTCDRCGAVNTPSQRSCHQCGRGLR